jgi:hypothetical protein
MTNTFASSGFTPEQAAFVQKLVEQILEDFNSGGSGFPNPITAGNILILQQLVLQGPNTALLVYSGTPALGNLVVALASGNGVDQFGNHYFTGLSFPPTDGTLKIGSIETIFISGFQTMHISGPVNGVGTVTSIDMVENGNLSVFSQGTLSVDSEFIEIGPSGGNTPGDFVKVRNALWSVGGGAQVMAVDSGTVADSLAAQIGKTITVTFTAGIFTVAPVLTLTVQVGANLDLGANIVSSTAASAQVRVFQSRGVAVTGNFTLHWHAEGI